MMHSKQTGESVKPRRNPMAQMRSFADGGDIDQEMEKQIAANQEKLNPKPKGLFGGLFSSSKPAPAPAPAPAAPTIVSNLQNRKNALEEANKSAGYSGGGKPGMKSGGKIVGPGTPTSDSIPAKVKETGENIAVSTDERILSGKQDAALESVAKSLGFPGLEAWLETMTGTPVGPTMKDGMAAAKDGADGKSFDDIANQNPLAQYRVKPASNLTSTAVAPPPSEMSAPAPPATGGAFANAVGGGISAIEGAAKYGLGAAAVPFGKAADAVKNTVAGAFDATRPNPNAGVEEARAMMQSGREDFSAASKAFDIAKNPLVKAAGWAPNEQQAPAPASAAPSAVTPAPASQAPATVTPPPAVTPAVVAPAANPTVQSRVGNSFTESNTVMNPANPLTTVNLAANNESMAKTNAIRQEMIDSQAGYRAEPGSSGGRIADSGRVEGDALLDKWGRQHDAKVAMDMAAANPKSAQAIASAYGSTVQGENALVRDASDTARNATNNTTLRRGQDARLQETGMQGDVTKRGQDVHAQIAANQVAGNPMNNALAGAQTEGVTADVETKKKNQALIDEVLNPATAPERKAAIMSAIGKGDKFAHAQGGTSIDPGTGLAIKTPDVIYNERTGQPVNAAPSSAQKLPMPKGYTAESMTKEAEAAVKAGKSRAAVAAELAKYGIAFK